jgi:kinetochore protein Mis12/MTW1
MTNEVLYRCTSILDTELSSLDPALLGFADRAAAEKRAPEVDEDGNAVFPEAKLEIEEGVLKLETLVENALDRNFDRLEIWTLRNIFSLERGGKKEGDKGSETEESVGRWMRLAHYEVSGTYTLLHEAHLTPSQERTSY